MTGIPPRLVLEHELAHGVLRRILLWHSTDRWYLGDFLRHISWLSCLTEVRPDRLDLATHRSYLPLFAGDARVDGLLDVHAMHAADLGGYDLAVVPSTFAPDAFDDAAARALYSWNTGWAYTRHGVVMARGTKNDLNYFTAARHHHGQTALPTAAPASLRPAPAALSRANTALRASVGARPIVVYNPTASNHHTRRSSVEKEVENVLRADEHRHLLEAIRDRSPGHDILVGSALVPGDDRNATTIRALGEACGVPTILDLGDPSLTTLGGYTALLGSAAVVASVGTSTGTNTHLAATVGLASFSVERGADAEMVANWSREGELPMGSFRWRNPSPLAGAVDLDWLRRTAADLDRVADAFAVHLRVHTGEGPGALADPVRAAVPARRLLASLDHGPPQEFVAAAIEVVETLLPDVRPIYADMTDAMAYLRRRPGLHGTHALRDVLDAPVETLGREAGTIRRLVQDSPLHKAAQFLAGPLPRPEPEAEHIDVFRTIRAGAPTTPARRRRLGVADEDELAEQLRERTADHLSHLAAHPVGVAIRAGWQHEVFRGADSVVKTLAANPASEYLTDEYTRRGIDDALRAAGGLVPPSGVVAGGPDPSAMRLCSRRITMLVEPGTDIMSQLFGGTAVPDTVLAPGWVDELVAIHLALLDHGVFNFDLTLKDFGVDRWGVAQIADFSVFRAVPRCRRPGERVDRRTDVFHLGVNEMVRHGQYLARFANGAVLLDRFADLIEPWIGADLRRFLPGWRWGDHDAARIVGPAEALRRFVENRAARPHPQPVFPLVDAEAEGIAFDYVATRLPARTTEKWGVQGLSSHAQTGEMLAGAEDQPGPIEPVVANTLSERSLREFFDPAGRRTDESIDDFLDGVAATRAPATIGALHLTGYEVVLAEGIHALLDDGDGLALPVSEKRQRAIADTIGRYADTVALSVIEVADELARDTVELHEKLRTGSLRPLPGRIVLAGRVLAAVAHEGEFRRSGRDFFMHPDEVASIVTTAWQRQMSDEDGRLDVSRFLAYGHDGFEDTIDPFGAYLSDKPVLMSPFVCRRVLEILGVPDAHVIARVLLLMTRTKDVDGNKMDYFDYLERGVREGGSLFLLTKAPDIHHNLNIEPEMIERGDRRARARYEKRDIYRAAADEMRIAAETCDAATAWVVHSVFAVAPVDIQATVKSDTLSIQEIAAAVRHKVADRSA